MLLQCFNQALFSEFVSRIVKTFSNAIAVECECVPFQEFAFRHRRIPFSEKSKHRTCRIEPFESAITAEKKRAVLSAVRVTQLSRVIIVFGKE